MLGEGHADAGSRCGEEGHIWRWGPEVSFMLAVIRDINLKITIYSMQVCNDTGLVNDFIHAGDHSLLALDANEAFIVFVISFFIP